MKCLFEDKGDWGQEKFIRFTVFNYILKHFKFKTKSLILYFG